MSSDSSLFGNALPGYPGAAKIGDESPKDATGFDTRLIVPIVVVLSFIAVINTLQAFYVFFSGDHSITNFVRFLVSNLFYSWYFIIPALAVRRLSTTVSLTRKTLLSWVSIHLSTLIVLTVVHQVTSLLVDRIVLGSRQSETVFSVLFNNPAIWGDFVAYVLFLLGFYMIAYRRRIQENEVKYSRLETELVKARLHELRNRIHPQFLLNTLGEVSSLVHRKRNKEANRVLSLLSDFLRITVYDNDREFTTVEEEVGFLDNFIAIESARFGNKLEVSRRIDHNALMATAPNFILQPIVEELVLRNLDSSGEPCEIRIEVMKEEDSINIAIKGRKKGGDSAVRRESAGEGIFNITRARLEQLYPGENEFSEGFDAEGWRIVQMRFPCRTSATISDSDRGVSG
jgi:two-component system sensor histidine kinase AlgZ